MSVIQDLSGNPLITQTSPMIGFQPLPQTADALNLDMYRFLIEVIRQEDQQNGAQFIERYLQGPQEVWKATTQSILDVKTLWDISAVEDRFLPFLKRIVGWTPDLDNITDALDALTLRRLIAASVPFWKRRGPEDAIEDILRLVTTARLRTFNWFDLRIVMDETALGEDWNGYDPWMVDVAGETEYNIRIVDDGTLNRQLVRDLARLTRPVGETAVISYIGFLDQFKTDNDNSQWTDEPDPLGLGGGATVSAVAGGAMTLNNGGIHEETYVSLPGSDSWSNYTVTWRIRGTSYRCLFYRTGNGDFYEAIVRPNGIVSLQKAVAGAVSVLDTFDLTTLPTLPLSDVYNAIRVEALPEAGQTRIKVYFEALQIMSHLDPSHSQGAIGIGHADFANDFVALDEVELFFNPLESDTISINS